MMKPSYKNRFWQKVGMMGIILLAAACSRTGDMCIYGDDFGDLVSNRVQVSSSNDGWMDTGVDVSFGRSMQIQSSGTVQLCGAQHYGAGTATSYTGPMSSSQWQDTGVSLQANDEYQTTVTGHARYCNGGCDIYNGTWSVAYFGTLSSLSCTNRPAGWVDLASGSIARNTVSTTGKLYIAFADPAPPAACNTGFYGDNTGGYTFTTRVWRNCTGTKGQYMIARIGPDPNTSTVEINLHDCTIGNASCGGHTDGIFNGNAPASGRLWVRVVDDGTRDWDHVAPTADNRGDGDYTPLQMPGGVYASGSNEGKYIVEVLASAQPSGGFSNVVNTLIDPVRDLLTGPVVNGVQQDGLTASMFKGLTRNGKYVEAVRAALGLLVVFMSMSFMVGLSRITQKELLVAAVRVGIIIALLSPNAWEFFYRYLFIFFMKGTDELIYVMSSQFTLAINGTETVQTVNGPVTTAMAVAPGNQDTFAFLNQTIGRFFTKATEAKLQGLATTWPLGIVYVAAIGFGMFYFLFAVGKAIILYLTSIVFTSLLLFLMPIYMPFMLFERTRNVFENLIKQLINFAVQPILLFMVLAIFNVFIFSAFHSLLSFTVCWDCVAELDLPFNTILGIPSNFDKICLLHNYKIWGVDDGQNLSAKLVKMPVGYFMVLIFLIFINALVKMTDWIIQVSTTLTAAQLGIDLMATGATAMVDKARSTVTASLKLGASAAKFGVGTGVAVAKGVGKVAKKSRDALLPAGAEMNSPDDKKK